MNTSGRIFAVALKDGTFALVEPWSDAVGWDARFACDWHGVVFALPEGSVEIPYKYKGFGVEECLRAHNVEPA